ncbi:peptidylprolyl isomerase, partial [Desulfovibrio sp. OttesenSCG-928-I05]|nr:peptidylprolyl isomerase [Desulfovibrio sp. OttesenSCG-928-I05]
QGKSVVDAEKDLASDILQDKLREYISLAVVATPDEARRMHAFQAERRTVSYVLFATEDYLDDVTPTEDQLQSFYNGNAQRFTSPDRTALSYIEVTPEALAGGVDVSAEEIDAAFAGGPSRYHLSQVLFLLPETADEAARAAAREKLHAMQNDLRGGKDLAAAIADASADDPSVVGGDAGWISVGQLDEKMAPIITGLVPGGLSDIIEAPAGLAFFRLEETDPDFRGHETVVKAAIRDSLAREHALLGFRETQEKVIESMDLGKGLDDIAAELGVSIRELPLANRALIPSALGLKSGTSIALFSGAAGSLIGNILETEGGFIVAKITEQQPSAPIPFADVRAEIENEVKRIEASRLAEKAANDHLPEFTGSDTPEAFREKVMTSAAFMRDGQTADFGSAPALAAAVFENAPGSWIPRSFAVQKGAVIAMTQEVQPLTDAEWQEREAEVLKAVEQGKQNALFSVYMEALNSSTTVSVPDARIFDMF